jgi:dolichol kinase
MLAGAAGAFAAIHCLRLRNEQVNKAFLALFKPIMREHEKKNIPGAFYFLLGCSASFFLFPLSLGILVVLLLSIGDPAASLVGTLCSLEYSTQQQVSEVSEARGTGNKAHEVESKSNSRDTLCIVKIGATPIWKGKTVAGSLTAVVVGALTAYWSMRSNMLPGFHSDDANSNRNSKVGDMWLCVLAGVACSVGELVPLGIDDNLALPLVAGLMLWPMWPEQSN